MSRTPRSQALVVCLRVTPPPGSMAYQQSPVERDTTAGTSPLMYLGTWTRISYTSISAQPEMLHKMSHQSRGPESLALRSPRLPLLPCPLRKVPAQLRTRWCHCRPWPGVKSLLSVVLAWIAPCTLAASATIAMQQPGSPERSGPQTRPPLSAANVTRNMARVTSAGTSPGALRKNVASLEINSESLA